MMPINKILAQELAVHFKQINAAVTLLDDGSTVPLGSVVPLGLVGVTIDEPPSPRTSRKMRNPSTSATTATATPKVPVLGDESDGRWPRGFCWLMEKVLRERNRRRPHGSGNTSTEG